MRLNKFIFILAFTAFALARASPAAGVRKFTVPGTAAWFDTQIDLKAGDRVAITATGNVHFCNNCTPSNDTGPDGFRQFSAGADAPGPGLPSVSLIARVGRVAPVYVGSGPTIVAGEGRLLLGFNDTFLPDNSGAFTVTVAPKGRGSMAWMSATVAALILMIVFLRRTARTARTAR